MPVPSLFPLFMLNPFAAGTGGGGDGIILELMADPDIILSDEVVILDLEDDTVNVTVEEPIEIEVD